MVYLCTFNILSFDVNEQLIIMVQKTQKVKERARPCLQRRLVNVTRPDEWSLNFKNKWKGQFTPPSVWP